jgi:hypothetical protein
MNGSTYVENFELETHRKPLPSCGTDLSCISSMEPLLQNARIGLIDVDTPQSAHKKKSIDGTTMNLVVS